MKSLKHMNICIMGASEGEERGKVAERIFE